MRITPLDVRKQEFRKAMRGLDAEEVYAFLSTVADEYEAVLNDNKALRERLLELDDRVQEYRSMEKTLRDTLLTAERVTVEAKDNARREANIIIKEAQMEAERALRDIKSEAAKMRQQVTQLRSHRDAYLAKLKVVAESHLSFVDSAQDDFVAEDRAIVDLDIAEPARASRKPDPVPRPVDNLFDPASRSAAPSSAGAKTGSPSPPTPKPNTVAPTISAPEPGQRPDRPDAKMEVLPESAVASEIRSDERELPQSTLSDINQIIDRVAKTQSEVLQAQARGREEDTEPSQPVTPPPTIEATTSLGSPVPMASERKIDSFAPTATADEPHALEASQPPVADPGDRDADRSAAPRGNDITGEWNIDQIRRDILGRAKRQTDD